MKTKEKLNSDKKKAKLDFIPRDILLGHGLRLPDNAGNVFLMSQMECDVRQKFHHSRLHHP